MSAPFRQESVPDWKNKFFAGKKNPGLRNQISGWNLLDRKGKFRAGKTGSGREKEIPGQERQALARRKKFSGSRGGDVLARRRKFWTGEYAPGE